MISDSRKPFALYSFTIGPVQGFIASARTARDLWSGSYILSWLTAHAMAKMVALRGKPLVGKYDQNPLYRLATGNMSSTPRDANLLSCLPNNFIATFEEADDAQLAEVAKAAEAAVMEEWCRIAAAVKAFLDEKWGGAHPGWDEGWDDQITGFWDLRSAWIPAGCDAVGLARGLRIHDLAAAGDPDFQARKMLLGRLAATRKMLRQVPPHEPPEETRPKCSLRGDLAQMGPRARGAEDPMACAADFWKAAAPVAVMHSERLCARDRFCAISLVKRFAWACYFHERTGFEYEPNRMHIHDTATIAAMDWLQQVAQNDPPLYEATSQWSGHWLHWADRLLIESPKNELPENEEPCPKEVGTRILTARERAKGMDLPARPPAYYAILALDGDRMGERFKNADGHNHLAISGTLAGFALERVPLIVENHLGTLIYAGGDDVLALLPTATALACAKAIHDELGALAIPGGSIASSAGIAVAHYKFNLQDAIQAAREAEKMAKKAGRDRFRLSILRRSGEHTTAVAPWICVDEVDGLVSEFRAGKSDRWAYQLRAGCATMLDGANAKLDGELAASLCAMIDADAHRLIKRKNEGEVPEDAENVWDRLVEKLINQVQGKGSPPLKARETALILVQSASFLARGKEEN
ncbi:MAG: type III-B CRISPR-associated protein Cas10/Cmr2 [bacterium]|nr:type III-B CRISPR-associated protein Cas10/Cmr2 [bacterium]